MKRIVLTACIGLVLLFSACAPEGWTYSPASQTPSFSASATPSPSQAEKPTPTLTPEQTFAPDTNIPGIVTGDESRTDSGSIYEDENTILITKPIDFEESGTYVLYSIDKQDGSAKVISRDCLCFTMLDGKAYFVEYDTVSEFYNTIKRYDPPADEVKLIKKLKYDICDIKAYKGKLYLSHSTEHHEDLYFNPSDLYFMNPDDKDIKLIKKDVDTFSIYKDIIYYSPPSHTNGAPLYKCGLDGQSEEKLLDSGDYHYAISNNKLYYIEHDFVETFIGSMYLDSHEPAETYDVTETFEVSDSYELFSHYVIYTDIDENGISYLYAFDIDTGKKCELLELGQEWYEPQISQDGACITWYDGTCMHIAKITMDGSRASLSYQKYAILAPIPFEYKQPSDDTVIIATGFGYICGGYSDGKWLTHGEAAAYCGGNLAFDRYNLVSRVDGIKSSGVQYKDESGGYSYSCSCDMPPDTYDETGDYHLNIPEDESDYDYSKNPLCYSYLYYGVNPPKIELVKDTSKLQPVIQKIVDKHLGEGNVKAKVRTAVKADIDGDGKKETIVNADNNAEEFESSLGDIGEEAVKKYWFCMCCIIESDGSVVIIDEYYEKPYKEGDEYPDMAFMYVQNVIDIDGDGVCEIVLDWNSWETFCTVVCKYDGKELKDTILFGFGS